MKHQSQRTVLIVAAICMIGCFKFLPSGYAQESEPTLKPRIDNTASLNEAPRGQLNWQTKTIGGMQFWSDVWFTSDWKIQRNSQTGHYRLLDPNRTRHAWGNLAHCHLKLQEKITAGTIRPNSGKFVILLHGLIRSDNSMNSMANFMESHGYQTVRFQYASTRETVDVHASDLKFLIDNLGTQVTEINFICHSLGNIVVRHYVADANKSGLPLDQRINRMVMLGPPNQGSKMARVLKNSFLFKTIAGASGAQLSLAWEQLEKNLATPPFEFGIISGGQQTEKNWSNFILQGKDDFTVSLEETKLAGADDTFVRPLLHSTMMNQPEVHLATLTFLQNGFFVAENQRQPIPDDWKFERKTTRSSSNSDASR